jgi:mRNA interferase MazF
VKQYEIWWAALPEPLGTRPVLLLSRNPAYEYLNSVLGVEVTTRVRGIPQEIRLSVREGMPKSCVANFDNLRSVPKEMLKKRIGAIAPRRVIEAKRALGYALGFIELTTL